QVCLRKKSAEADAIHEVVASRPLLQPFAQRPVSDDIEPCVRAQAEDFLPDPDQIERALALVEAPDIEACLTALADMALGRGWWVQAVPDREHMVLGKPADELTSDRVADGEEAVEGREKLALELSAGHTTDGSADGHALSR